MNRLEKLLFATAIAAMLGCETPKPQNTALEPQTPYSAPNTIRMRGNGARRHAQQERITVIVNDQHPNGLEIRDDGTVTGPVVAPVETLTIVQPRTSYPESVPKGWVWEQPGNWYRSPDRRYLWIDGSVRQSLEPQTRRPDHELIPHGSEQYAPKRNR